MAAQGQLVEWAENHADSFSIRGYEPAKRGYHRFYTGFIAIGCAARSGAPCPLSDAGFAGGGGSWPANPKC